MKKGYFNNKLASILTVVLSLVIVILLNFAASFEFRRFDLTNDQRYTLKPSTKALLSDEDRYKDRVIVQVYLDGKFPAEWKKLKKEIQIKLEEYRAYAGSRLEYEFINPYAGSEEKQKQLRESLAKKGLFPLPVPVMEDGEIGFKEIFPGAILKYPGAEDVALNFMPRQIESQMRNRPRSFDREGVRYVVQETILNLEYSLTRSIKKIITFNPPVITILEGHGELDELQTQYIEYYLGEYYTVQRKNIKAKDKDSVMREDIHALDNTDLLMIAKPESPFSEREKFVIDQFIMRGGKVMWMIDPINGHRDSLDVYGRTYGLSRELNLMDQLFKYGVRIDNKMVLDEFCGPVGIPDQNGRYRSYPWYFYPLATNDKYHPITAQIDPVKLEYACTIDTLAAKPGVKKSVLLHSSDRALYFKPPIRIFYDWIRTKPKFPPEGSLPPRNARNKNQPPYIMGVLYEGEFESLFKNILAPEFVEKNEIKFLEKSKAPTKMIVIGDGDIMRNDIDSLSSPGRKKPIPIEYSLYTNQRVHFGNKDFMLNAVDYLLGDETLIASRSKRTLHLLDMNKVKDEKSKWQFINVTLPLLILFAFGIAQYFIRKYKYAK